tara:strand:+ start:116389 stop:116733 length:345 start_codon:yes stop_codon:yes gene_type:complete
MTDAQSFVMFTAMNLMVVISLITLGGVPNFIDQLYNVSPDYMALFPDTTFLGSAALALWCYFELNNITYEIVPGILSGFAVYALCGVLQMHDIRAKKARGATTTGKINGRYHLA